MTPEDHVHLAMRLSPALRDVIHGLDATVQTEVMQAIILAVQQAQHDERRLCATVALEYLEAAADPACQALAEAIATAIIARDTELLEPEA